MAKPSTKSHKTDETEQPDKGGRPAFEPTADQRKTVKAMAGYGIPHDDIARVVDIAPKTLRKHFRDELDTGETIATVNVARNLYAQATGTAQGSVGAAIFWLKARAGWSEKVTVENVGKDGGPIQYEDMAADERAQRIEDLIARRGSGADPATRH